MRLVHNTQTHDGFGQGQARLPAMPMEFSMRCAEIILFRRLQDADVFSSCGLDVRSASARIESPHEPLNSEGEAQE